MPSIQYKQNPPKNPQITLKPLPSIHHSYFTAFCPKYYNDWQVFNTNSMIDGYTNSFLPWLVRGIAVMYAG